MKAVIGLLILFACAGVQAQDSSYTYAGWGKPATSQPLARDLLTGKPYTEVFIDADKPVLIKRFDEDHELFEHVENEYDEYGNHISSKRFDTKGHLREENIFQNDPTEMELFQKIFGNTFVAANSNFMIRRTYNEFERETGYFILGVTGQKLYSRVTSYRDDRRKDREVLRDELEGKILTERRYKYNDAENRTVLEEYDGSGKLIQRVILFDHHDLIQE